MAEFTPSLWGKFVTGGQIYPCEYKIASYSHAIHNSMENYFNVDS